MSLSPRRAAGVHALLADCSRECQEQHWKVHKRTCSSPLGLYAGFDVDAMDRITEGEVRATMARVAAAAPTPPTPVGRKKRKNRRHGKAASGPDGDGEGGGGGGGDVAATGPR